MSRRDIPVILVNHLLEPPSRITGITRYLFAVLEELVSNGAFRYVLVTTWPRGDLPKRLQATDVIVQTRPFIESTPLNVAMQMAVVPRLMRQNKAVLEFNCNPMGCFWSSWPRVIALHDLYYELMPYNFPMRHRMWWNLFFPRSLDAAWEIICVSETSRQHLNRLHPKARAKSIVVHEAGALRDEVCNDDAESDGGIAIGSEPYGVYVGNISRNKNPDVLVDALKLLEQRGHFIPIYHVGRDDLSLLADSQSRVGLQCPVRAMGTTSDAMLAAIYREAHCLVNTSLDEGFCLPVLEAQSRGLPVVCSDIPVLREVAGDGALFFNPTDPLALADSLSDIFIDASLHARIGERARQNAKLFSWKKAADETEAVFREVLSRRVPSAKRH